MITSSAYLLYDKDEELGWGFGVFGVFFGFF